MMMFSAQREMHRVTALDCCLCTEDQKGPNCASRSTPAKSVTGTTGRYQKKFWLGETKIRKAAVSFGSQPQPIARVEMIYNIKCGRSLTVVGIAPENVHDNSCLDHGVLRAYDYTTFP